jgi:PAS domain S-box-containing protein
VTHSFPEHQLPRELEALRREVERLRALATHDDSMALLKSILEHSPQGIIVCNAQGELVLHSRGAERIWAGSATAGDVAEWGQYRAFHPDGKPYGPGDWAMARCLSHGAVTEAEEVCIQRFDGTFATLVASCAPTFDADGKITGALAIFADVTALKHAESERQRLERELVVRSSELDRRAREFALLADTMPQLVWMAQPNGFTDYFNRNCLAYTGLTAAELKGERWTKVIHPDDVEVTVERWYAAVKTGDPYEVLFRLRSASGSYRWFLGRAAALRNEQGEIERWMGTCTDIDDQRSAEAELATQVQNAERLIVALERSNADLDQFAYVASHDLKAPLRGIGKLAEWLEEDLGEKLVGESRRHLELMRRRVQRMEGLVDGILAYARAGRTREEPDLVEPQKLLQDVSELLVVRAPARVELVGNVAPFTTERVPFEQVLLNLVGNSIKHGKRDDILVEVQMVEEGDSVRLRVSDNGPGIPQQYHERVWEIFQTLEPRDQVESTGIGLSLVKKVVEGRGGRVWLESEPNAGTTFHVVWPKQDALRLRR